MPVPGLEGTVDGVAGRPASQVATPTLKPLATPEAEVGY